MIFRKPYAILIKYFKLIHVLLTIIMAYLVYRTYNLFHFLSEYMKTTMLRLGKGATETMFNSYMYILPVLLIVFSLILLVTLTRKNKPKTIYVVNVLVFSLLFVLNVYLKGQFLYLEENIMSARDVRLMFDFTLIMLLIQITILIPTMIRAIGFDIKKFDFKRDLLDMDIDDADKEEFEVSFNVEGNVLERFLNKNIRNIKYAYLENKFLFKVLALVLIIFIVYSIFKGTGVNNTILNMNEGFQTEGLTIEVSDSFVTQRDYKLQNITSSLYVIVELNAKANQANTKFNTARMQLIVDNNIFYPVEEVSVDYFSDLGQVYVDENISVKDYTKSLIVYEIPSNFKNSKYKFRYISVFDMVNPSYVSVALKTKNLDKEVEKEDVKLKKEIILNKDVLDNSTLEINSFEIAEDFVNNYKYCPQTGECYSSKEYLRPNLNSTRDKALLKIDASFIKGEGVQINGASDAFNLINKFGTIVYKYNGTTYKMRGSLVQIKPKKSVKKNVYYIEVNKKMIDCEYAYLLLKIRNKEYKYIIKNL